MTIRLIGKSQPRGSAITAGVGSGNKTPAMPTNKKGTQVVGQTLVVTVIDRPLMEGGADQIIVDAIIDGITVRVGNGTL